MKLLVVLACFLAVAYGITPAAIEHIKSKIHDASGVCKTETGASDADVSRLMTQKVVDTKETKCYVACLNKKMGIQDKSGKIDKDGTYAEIEKMKPLDADLYEKLKKIADTCLAEVTDAADECETAAALVDCGRKQKSILGIIKVDFSS